MRNSQRLSPALVASILKVKSSKKNWDLRWKPVCSSTEKDLSSWMSLKPFNGYQYRAIFASRQLNGRGQYGRLWDSPRGGAWVSAALPYQSSIETRGLFGLAVALAISNKLKEFNIPVKIKWPNDLIVEKRKLAGFLPRVIICGSDLKYARIGIGLNVSNKVPLGAISLEEVFGIGNISLNLWTAEILIALENAMMLLQNPYALCRSAEKFLWSDQIIEETSKQTWSIQGFNLDGSLKIKKGFKTKALQRWE